jgi:hypothetical protein
MSKALDKYFKDEKGREVIYRGVNLPAKIPSKLSGEDHRKISFVGRPFPLDEADEHFGRLSNWGFNLLRLSVSWEAIEHSGLGVYDEDYLIYLEGIVSKASQYGFKIFIDFHQDVWSRFTGGDGAPGWTLELAGFYIPDLEETGAAVLHKASEKKSHILWPTNAYKLAAATMFTLFFGGSYFAPNKIVLGKNIGDLLQEAYINMVKVVVKRLKKHEAVIGYDIMNEPLSGYIGRKDLHKKFGLFQLGNSPTPFQSMVLGDGNSVKVDVWKQRYVAILKTEKKELNHRKKRAWQNSSSCIWKDHGVWDYNEKGKAILLKPDYFKNHNFEEEFYKPFLNKVAKAIHEISPDAFLLIEHVVGSKPPHWSEADAKNIIFTTHWYDGVLLVTKKFFSFFGYDILKKKKLMKSPKGLRKAFANQIRELKNFAKKQMNGAPIMITEFGIPLDLKDKKAYKTGDFSLQDKALDRSFLAIDDNQVSSIIWNYTSHNLNKRGDHWNGEDFSIYSKDQNDNSFSIYSGARAKNAFIRPYPMKIAGRVEHIYFNMKKKEFEFTFEHTIEDVATEIFLPNLHFGDGFTIQLSDGSYEIDGQTLKYFHTNNLEKHTVIIKSI